MTPSQVEAAARESLNKAYERYPMGCNEDEMREFLKDQPYPTLSYAILTQPEEIYKPMIEALAHGS